jgi:serine/threonine-protein kinase RsbW
MPEKTFRLNLQSTYEESEKIPDFVSDLQPEAGLTDDETSNLMLLVSEAVTNAIEHGNQLHPEKKVDLEIAVTDKAITTIVTDEGEGFDPEEETENPLDEANLLSERGRGVFLLKELSDELVYLNGGRTVKFVILRNTH